MTNWIYGKALEQFATAGVNWSSDTIRWCFYRSTGGGGPYYSPNENTDDFFDDIPSNTDALPLGTATSNGIALTSKTYALGVLDAADSTASSVTAGEAIQGIVIYKDTGVASTSPLLIKIDSATGLPFTPNNGDADVAWNASGIATI